MYLEARILDHPIMYNTDHKEWRRGDAEAEAKSQQDEIYKNNAEQGLGAQVTNDYKKIRIISTGRGLGHWGMLRASHEWLVLKMFRVTTPVDGRGPSYGWWWLWMLDGCGPRGHGYSTRSTLRNRRGRLRCLRRRNGSIRLWRWIGFLCHDIHELKGPLVMLLGTRFWIRWGGRFRSVFVFWTRLVRGFGCSSRGTQCLEVNTWSLAGRVSFVTFAHKFCIIFIDGLGLENISVANTYEVRTRCITYARHPVLSSTQEFLGYCMNDIFQEVWPAVKDDDY